jgi:hypothetical protein
MPSKQTIKLLAAETDNDVDDADVRDNIVDFGAYEEYIVFPSYDAAERYAKQYLIEMVDENPENINPNMLSYYLTMRPGDIRHFASDSAQYIYDDNDDGDIDSDTLDEMYEEEHDRIEKQLRDDPIGYFEDMGISAADAAKKGWLVIDTDALVRDALINDGVQGIIGAEDVIELDNGAEAYKR